MNYGYLINWLILYFGDICTKINYEEPDDL